MGCLKHSEPNISEKIIFQYPTDDAAYDIEVLGDTLYVANGTDGMRILKINLENQISLDSIFVGSIATSNERFVDINIHDGFIFLLEKSIFQNAATYVLENTFPINVDTYLESNEITYVSKVVYSGLFPETGVNFLGEVVEKDLRELIYIKKNLNAYNSFRRSAYVYRSQFERVELGSITYPQAGDNFPIRLNRRIENDKNIFYDECKINPNIQNSPCNDGEVVDCRGICAEWTNQDRWIIDGCGNCVDPLLPSTCENYVDCNGIELGNSYLNPCGDCISVINYKVKDIEVFEIDNEKYLYLTNASEDTTSIQIFKESVDDRNSFDFIAEHLTDGIPLTIKVYDESYIVGKGQKKGAIMTFFNPTTNIKGDKFNLATGYTIQDIRFNQELEILTFSLGVDGVLVYGWDSYNPPVPIALISSSYAYSALAFDNNTIIVATKNGVEIYEI